MNNHDYEVLKSIAGVGGRVYPDQAQQSIARLKEAGLLIDGFDERCTSMCYKLTELGWSFLNPAMA